MPTSAADATSSPLFGPNSSRATIEVDHDVKIGSSAEWDDKTVARSSASSAAVTACTSAATQTIKVYSDLIILARDDGELTTVTMDEFTRLRRM